MARGARNPGRGSRIKMKEGSRVGGGCCTEWPGEQGVLVGRGGKKENCDDKVSAGLQVGSVFIPKHCQIFKNCQS